MVINTPNMTSIYNTMYDIAGLTAIESNLSLVDNIILKIRIRRYSNNLIKKGNSSIYEVMDYNGKELKILKLLRY